MVDFRWSDWHGVQEYFEQHNYPNPVQQQDAEEMLLAWREFVGGDLLCRDGRFERVFTRYSPCGMTKHVGWPRGGPENLFPDFYAFAVGYSGEGLGFHLMVQLVASKAKLDKNPNLWGLTSGIQKAHDKGHEASIRARELKLESRLLTR